MEACPRCTRKLSSDKITRLPVCSSCKKSFHFECSSIAAKTWNYYNTETKKTWKCIDCNQKVTRPKVTRPISAVSSTETSPTSNKGSSDLKRTKLDVMNFNLEDIKAVCKDAVKEEVQILRDDIVNFQVSLNMKVTEIERENAELKENVRALQQYTRKNSVIISGIPKPDKEDPAVTSVTFAKEVGFNLQISDIDACHRLPSKVSPPPLLIKFISRITKTNFIIHCRNKKPRASIMGGDANKSIYVNEHLTKFTADVLKYTKEKLASKGFSITTRDCSVVAIQQGTKKKIKITTREQADQVEASVNPNTSTS